MGKQVLEGKITMCSEVCFFAAVGGGAGAHEDADVWVGGASELVHEDVEGLGFTEG